MGADVCFGCGRALGPKAVRCMYCGATKAPPKPCPKCQRTLDASARRCVFCNIELGGVQAPAGPDPRALALARVEGFREAERLRKAGQVRAALELIDHVLLVDPKFAPAWLARGKCLATLGDTGSARDAARTALSVDASFAEARALHDVWAKVSPPGAIDEAGARHAASTALEAQRLLEAGRDAEALALFDALVAAILPDRRDAPELAALHTSRGIALQHLGRLDEALASLAEALRVGPRYALAWQNHASILDDLGRVDDAIRSAERAVELDATRANAWVDLGVYRKRRGDRVRAAEAYRVALEQDPKHPLAWHNLGNVLHELGDVPGAEHAYRSALAASPGFEPAASALARLAAAPKPRPAPPPSLPPGRPYKTFLDRAASGDAADDFFVNALPGVAELRGLGASAAYGWICHVPGQPGAELLADVMVGKRAYCFRSALGAAETSPESLGLVGLHTGRDLLDARILEEVVWVVDAPLSDVAAQMLASIGAEVARPSGMRVLLVGG